MKKKSRSFLCVFLSLFLCFVMTSCGENYKAEELKSQNDEGGWLCTFDFLDGDYSCGFKINSGTLKITSSIQTGEMTVCVTGGGQNTSFDGRSAEERILSSDFGNEGEALYVTLKCDNARKGKVRVIWLADETDEASVSETSEISAE